ncbi:hypothetical protein Tco_0823920 [Tanacetum coccineum]|uniref:Uncharacterized protein n=1 Tax=Tanacetum coccineum TaxID=301880 RepID=A0ABQ5AJ89_9ASTR
MDRPPLRFPLQPKSPCPQGGRTDRLLGAQTTIPKSLLLVNFPSIGLTLDESKVPDAKPHASHKSLKVTPLDALHTLPPVTVLASCQISTLCVSKYCVSDLSSCAGSELGSELTILAGSELMNSELKTSELQCKENGVNILKLIDEGPFQMGTFWETLAEGNEGALHLDAPGRLRDSNYDQLYAYLKQHEAHANENKMMLERFTQPNVDPLALMSNVSHQQYHSQSSTTPPSTYVPPHFADNTQLDLGLSLSNNLIENLTNTLALLTQSYKTYLPQTNNQLRTSSNPRNQATVQDGRVVVQNVQGQQNRGQGNNAQGADAAGYGGAQNIVGNVNTGQARQVKCYNCNAQENRVALDEEQLLFITGGQNNAIDKDVDEQPVQDLALNMDNVFQADDYDAFDSDIDEAPMAQTMFMANLSSVDPVYDEAEHEMHDDVQLNYVVDSHDNYTSYSNMIPYVKDNAVPVVQSNVSSVLNDAYMMIFNDMHEPHAQSVSDITRNTGVDNSLTAELATYKEQVELYERRARFKLTERE